MGEPLGIGGIITIDKDKLIPWLSPLQWAHYVYSYVLTGSSTGGTGVVAFPAVNLHSGKFYSIP